MESDSNLKRYCFTGTRGVGKSTLVQKVKDEFSSIIFTAGSDILKEMMGGEYKNFEYLPENEKSQLRFELNQNLRKMQQESQKDIFVDAHLTVCNLKTGIIENIFTENEIEFYTDIVLLDSTPEKVLENRRKDTTKERILDLDLISKELEFEKKEAIKVCSDYNLKLHIIKVGDNEVEKLKDILME
ncbi:AAA family ATPase [Methanimicrococcus sp. OttesenSCG-928-J09]|nr:AAA family ATPase [Methanimicrococcus sp. OttesenSCG-928-J09]